MLPSNTWTTCYTHIHTSSNRHAHLAALFFVAACLKKKWWWGFTFSNPRTTLCVIGAYKYNIKEAFNLCGYRPPLLTLITTGTERCCCCVQKVMLCERKPHLEYCNMTCYSYFCTTMWLMNAYYTSELSEDLEHKLTHFIILHLSTQRTTCYFFLWIGLTKTASSFNWQCYSTLRPGQTRSTVVPDWRFNLFIYLFWN